MQRIFHCIKAGEYPSRERLAADIEVTTKTIQRDLTFMRDRMNLPISYHGERRGYGFDQPVGDFPLLELTHAEVISVYVAEKALTQYKGTSFEHPLRTAFEKLMSSLKGNITVSWSDLDSLISFRSFETTPMDLTTYQKVSEGVQRSLVLEFEYRKLNSQTFEKRQLEPYHLACILSQWYCFGRDLRRRDMRTFVLTRMRNTHLTAREFTRPKDFSIERHLADSFGVFATEGKQHVRVHFDAFAAQLIRERVWHASQKIQERPNGELEMALTLSSLEEIEPWVLSWGAHACVLEPAALRERMSATANKLTQCYQKRGRSLGQNRRTT